MGRGGTQTIMNWINKKNQSPPPSSLVLIYEQYRDLCALCLTSNHEEDVEVWTYPECDDIDWDYTHWMLVEPPK